MEGVGLVVGLAVPALVHLTGVVAGEQGGDVDGFGAACGAVAAGGAGNAVLPFEQRLHPLHGGLFGVGEGRKIAHVRGIFLQLCQCAHAGQHHRHPLVPGGEPHRGGGRGKPGLRKQQLTGRGQLVSQTAALHRLHHHNGLAVAAADLPAAAALDAGVVQIGVVELDLHKFQLRVVGEDLIQHGGLVVEGHAHVAHLSLGFQLLHRLKSAAGREFFVIVGVQCVV